MNTLTQKVDSLYADAVEPCSTSSTFHPINTPPEWKERSTAMLVDIMDDNHPVHSPHNMPNHHPTTNLERLAVATTPTIHSKTAFSQMCQSASTATYPAI
jgi:hypothetical protein